VVFLWPVTWYILVIVEKITLRWNSKGFPDGLIQLYKILGVAKTSWCYIRTLLWLRGEFYSLLMTYDVIPYLALSNFVVSYLLRSLPKRESEIREQVYGWTIETKIWQLQNAIFIFFKRKNHLNLNQGLLKYILKFKNYCNQFIFIFF